MKHKSLATRKRKNKEYALYNIVLYVLNGLKYF